MAEIQNTVGMRDAEAFSGYSRSTIEYHIRRGNLPHTRNRAGEYRITLDDLRALATKPKYARSRQTA